MPEGSSSEAPVIMPGPKILRNRLRAPGSAAASTELVPADGTISGILLRLLPAPPALVGMHYAPVFRRLVHPNSAIHWNYKICYIEKVPFVRLDCQTNGTLTE